VTDQRPQVVLASTRKVFESDVTEPQLDRLRTFADFRFGEFNRPTSWDEPPPPDADTIAKLREGELIACLDVFDPEPIPVDSPVRDMPNVFLTPHIAGVNAAGGPRFFKLMVDELERFFAGHETRYDLLPRTLANRLGLAPPHQA
jgi:hypothetical protein